MSRPSFTYMERFAAGIFLFLLFAPKVNLIDFGGSGVRIDDVLLLVFSIFFLLSIENFAIPAQFRFFILFLLFGFVSLFFASIQGRVNLSEALLYWIRNIEYLIFFVVGAYAARLLDLRRSLIALTIFLVLLAVLQQFAGISLADRFAGSGRFSGNTGGPYELAVICAFLFLYFISYQSRFLYVVLAFVLLILTQSRITLIATAIVLAVHYGKGKKGLILTGCIFLLVLGAVISESSIAERFVDFFRPDTYLAIWNNSASIPVFTNTFSYREWAFVDMLSDAFASAGDVSAFIRFLRWTSLLGSVQVCGISCWVFGLGPSFGSSAVDGNLVRFIVEYGIFGSLLFYVGLWRIVASTKSRWLKQYFAVLFLTSIAIDIFVAYKAMAVLWFACGYILKHTEPSSRVNLDATTQQNIN